MSPNERPFVQSDFTPSDLTPNALEVLQRRYLLKDESGKPCETPDDLFWRVAEAVASAGQSFGDDAHTLERYAERYYQMMASLDFLPNSPTLMNAGRPDGHGQLSACFVLPVEDSLESIFDTLKHAALIHQSGGGTGFSFSRLRPRGDVVRSTMGVSSGPVSFMEVYNAATEAIKQGGTRRGANMGILRVDHPDIEEFIACKDDLGRVTNFNISVGITNAFMKAVASQSSFDLVHPKTGDVFKTIEAQDLFNTLIRHAWQSGEPGVVFLDEINRHNPVPAIGAIESTNPCGEVPLQPYEACNLGSINLSRFVTISKNGNTELDWERLTQTVWDATRFLDDVITVNHFPLPQIQKAVEGNRKIGLGVMGWADALLHLNIPYNSDDAVELGRDVACWIDYQSKLASLELAQHRGAFPNFKQSLYADYSWLMSRRTAVYPAKITLGDWQALGKNIEAKGLRNATVTCIAPTGTISMIAGCSGGIEPVFAYVFSRNVMDQTHLSEVNILLKTRAVNDGFDSNQLWQHLAEKGTLAECDGVPDAIKKVFVCAFDVAPVWHVKMQASFQAFTDNGVSKTINFPESATEAQVAQAYQLASTLGLKGITVYRNNSRQFQPMALTKDAVEKSHSVEEEALMPTNNIICVDCD